MAWCASPDYLWDVSGWDGILAQAYYRPSAVATWKDAADMSRASIQEYSTRWMHYPYPQISAVEGPVSGMEYPMVAMEARDDSKEGLYGVVTHEIGHMWYPMMVGSDERRYAWMDEGFNTFINIYSEQGYFTRDDTKRRIGETSFVMMNDQAPTAQPIMTYANVYRTGGNLGSLAYIKPGIGLFLLREKVLGHEVFDASFQEYTRRWAFKHPQPSDFFRSMEDGSGRDLDWFWRGWFYSTGVLDQSVENVKQTTARRQHRDGGRDAPEPGHDRHAGRAAADLQGRDHPALQVPGRDLVQERQVRGPDQGADGGHRGDGQPRRAVPRFRGQQQRLGPAGTRYAVTLPGRAS